MGKILQFLSKIELGIHLISLLIFIPTTIIVFLPHNNSFQPSQLQAYTSTYHQIMNSFILSTNPQRNCTLKEIYLNNDYCLERCTNQKQCSVIRNNEECPPSSSYYYSLDNVKYCSSQIIINNINSNSLNHNDQNRPIYQISQEGQITLFTYAPESPQSCQSLSSLIGESLSTYSDFQVFLPFKQSLQFLWFTTLPIMISLTTFLFVNKCCKFNLRIPILILSITLSVSEMSLMIKGISLFALGQLLQEDLTTLSDCMLEQQKSILGNIQINYGLNEGFSYFCGVICLILALMIGVLLVIRIVQYKYWVLKKKEIDVYELQQMK